MTPEDRFEVLRRKLTEPISSPEELDSRLVEVKAVCRDLFNSAALVHTVRPTVVEQGGYAYMVGADKHIIVLDGLDSVGVHFWNHEGSAYGVTKDGRIFERIGTSWTEIDHPAMCVDCVRQILSGNLCYHLPDDEPDMEDEED